MLAVETPLLTEQSSLQAPTASQKQSQSLVDELAERGAKVERIGNDVVVVQLSESRRRQLHSHY